MNSIIYCIIFILSTLGLIDVVYRLGQNRKEEDLLKGLEKILDRHEQEIQEDDGVIGDILDEFLDLFCCVRKVGEGEENE